MKKIFPILALFTFIAAISTIRDFYFVGETTAMQMNREGEKREMYQKLFKTAEIKYPTKSVKLSEIKKPIVIVHFWATWCLPCIKEFPGLVKMIDEHKDVVEVIGIATDDKDTEKDVRKLQKKYKHNFESALDQSGSIIEKFYVATVPYTIIYIKGKVFEITSEPYNFHNSDFISEVKKLKSNR